MALSEMVAKALEEKASERQALEQEISKRKTEVEALATLEKRDATDEELTSVTSKGDELRQLDEEIASLEARKEELESLEKREQEALLRAKEVRVPATAKGSHSEPSTYRADNEREVNFLQDAWLTHKRDGSAFDARSRIERHMNEYRDVATSAVGGFVIPQYKLDKAAEYAANGAPLANYIFRDPEPTTMSTVIPTVTTAASAAAQASQNSAVSETDIAVTNITVPTVTIAGQQDIARQALELGTGVQDLIFRELLSQWHTALDSGIINTDGTSGTIEGLLASDSIGTSTYTDGTPTVPEFLVQLGNSIADVTTACKAGPDVIVVHPRRWEWLLVSVGSDGRPLVQVDNYNAQNEVGRGRSGYGQVGTIRGIPVIVDANVPINLGSGTDEDRVIVAKTDEFYFAAPEQPRMLNFEESLGGSLTTKAVVYGYAAFTAERRAGATSVMSGTGLIL